MLSNIISPTITKDVRSSCWLQPGREIGGGTSQNTSRKASGNNLIAAYVLGYKVTPDDAQKAPWIKAAQGATDTGVTICYNSVSDVKYLKSVISAPNVMCINPVNWKTDATPATCTTPLQ